MRKQIVAFGVVLLLVAGFAGGLEIAVRFLPDSFWVLLAAVGGVAFASEKRRSS